MKNTKTTIKLEEIKKNPAALTNATPQEALAPYKEALENYKDACAKFKKDAKEKDTGTDSRLRDLDYQLDANEKQVEELTVQLPEASLKGGAELIALEDQIDDLNNEAAKLKRRINQLEKIGNPGREDLFQEVLAAYEELREVEAEANANLTQIEEAADEWMKYFKAVKDDASNAKEWGPGMTTRSGSKSYNKDLVKIAEQHLGEIDVSGHTCGSDEVAKVRYLRGEFKGIENTPAYKNRRAK
jgi:chromosome segregation ATPase